MSKLNRNQKAMLFAEGIVERYRARGNQLPHRSKTCRMDPNREQEYKDAAKLNDWKQSLKGNRGTCSPEIRNYLDLHIPYWRTSSRGDRNNNSDNGSARDSDEENSDVCQSQSHSQLIKNLIPGAKQSQLRSQSLSQHKHTTASSTPPLHDHTTNIEAEVCYAMMSKFSQTQTQPQQTQTQTLVQDQQQHYSPLSEWNVNQWKKKNDHEGNHNIHNTGIHNNIHNNIRKRYDSSSFSSHNPNPLSCTEKRTDENMNTHKRQRTDAATTTAATDNAAMEMSDEVNRQIRLDSELLLHLMYSGRGQGASQSISSH